MPISSAGISQYSDFSLEQGSLFQVYFTNLLCQNMISYMCTRCRPPPTSYKYDICCTKWHGPQRSQAWADGWIKWFYWLYWVGLDDFVILLILLILLFYDMWVCVYLWLFTHIYKQLNPQMCVYICIYIAQIYIYTYIL